MKEKRLFPTLLRGAVSLLLPGIMWALGGSAANAQSADYAVAHGADVNITHATHYPKTVSIYGTQSEKQTISDIATAPKCAAYFDKTSTVFEVKAGDIVTPDMTINGSWMHGYVFVDWDNSKSFEVNLTGNGPYTKGDGNELMCWSLYSKTGDGTSGYNSAGDAVSGDISLSPGTFRVPENLAVGSTYRMRYVVQWNSTDPTGAGDKFITDGGSIIDVTLKITGKAENVTPYPIDDYTEPRTDTEPDATEWNAIADGLNATWATRDTHYLLHQVPAVKQKDAATLHAWKGERANILAVLYSKTAQGKMTVRMTEWKKDGTATGVTTAGTARFVNYVITDDYDACGTHPTTLPTWLSADVIDQDKAHDVPAMETRPVWCTVEVPRDIEAGDYTTSLEVVNAAGDVVKSLALTVSVDSHSLPEVKDQKFHLDLWQQPYSVSRYYDVDRWSDKHIEALRPYLAALGRAGQTTVSAIMFYEPWGAQSHDKFDPMVQTTKKTDGTWAYDYTVFDKYVELCAEYGIDKQINCFSMVPWDMSFRYWDEASSSYKTLTTTTSADNYKELWTDFLTKFKAHLTEKGWFDKTNIAMDERQESDMLNAYNIANSLGFKMALAGNYHSSLTDKLQDFCVALGQDKKFTSEQLASRKAKGQVTTFYTSCADTEPNIFSNSYPAEAAFLPLYAAANGLDGYLHWSFINWDEHPLTDSRFRLFGSGDTYCYYPGNRSSVRFERLIEGIHQYEKVQILKEEYKDNAAKLAMLDKLLSRFTSAPSGTDCAGYVNDIEDFLNGLEVEIDEPKDVTTGYYHLVSKATSRTENLYNNAFLSGNTYKFTLQSDTKVETNNGIWHVTVKDGGKLGVVNGDGQPIVAGKSYASGIAGSFSELNIGQTTDAGEYRYYYFTEALNCSNGGSYYKLNGVDYLTTWADGGATKEDNLWRFEPADTEGKTIYTVSVTGDADAYVSYKHGSVTEKAFDGGFFLADGDITASSLTAGILSGTVTSANISVEGNTIKVTDIVTPVAPESQDLFNTSKGDGVIPPYRIPGVAVCQNGRLIATAARLVCGTDPGFGQVDVVCRTSDDNGATWSDIREVAVGTGKTSATENYFDTAYGDPAVVADRTSQEAIIVAVAGCTYYPSANTTRSNPNLVALIRSHDNGETWDTPTDITEQVYSLFDEGTVVQAAFVAGGRIFQSRIVKTGKYYRLYAALCARPGGNRVIYSDDFGATWHALGGADALPVSDGNEAKCDELPDGRVIITSRTSGGRYMNIYTYTDTESGEGQWEAAVKCTFPGSGLTPGKNDCNGEMLILPVQRNSDKKDMYLALQSIPTGDSRTNVGIYYKELTDVTDLDKVKNFALDWNGFCQVSKTASAYSSMDWQKDGNIGFIWEETLTGWGQRANPVTTSFPTGAGTHNFDGYDNLYAPFTLEYITGGQYTIKADASRGAFLKDYFAALMDASSTLSDDTKAQVKAAAAKLADEPTTSSIDRIYSLIAGETPADPWDGYTVTLTNVQKAGAEYALYVDTDSKLKISASAAKDLGETAQFDCKKLTSGKYTFFNAAAKRYMIWRAGDTQDYGYNSNMGTLDSYDATYCDWSVNDASGSIADTYYLVSKRKNGSTDGSLIVMATGVFDAWGASAGLSDKYSNLFRIDVVGKTVGISSAQTEVSARPAAIYDLSGRRVQRPGRGVYIVNGKKMVF